MNLLEIILQYLEKCETDSPREGDQFLAHLVKDAGLSRSLVKHIKGCWPNSTVKHLGSFLADGKLADEPLSDVNAWTIQVTS